MLDLSKCSKGVLVSVENKRSILKKQLRDFEVPDRIYTIEVCGEKALELWELSNNQTEKTNRFKTRVKVTFTIEQFNTPENDAYIKKVYEEYPDYEKECKEDKEKEEQEDREDLEKRKEAIDKLLSAD